MGTMGRTIAGLQPGLWDNAGGGGMGFGNNVSTARETVVEVG